MHKQKCSIQSEGGTLNGAAIFYIDFYFLQGVQYNCNCAVRPKGIISPLNRGWYFVPLTLVVLLLIGINEAGYGVIALLPLLPLAYWLMEKAFGEE